MISELFEKALAIYFPFPQYVCHSMLSCIDFNLDIFYFVCVCFFLRLNLKSTSDCLTAGTEKKSKDVLHPIFSFS